MKHILVALCAFAFASTAHAAVFIVPHVVEVPVIPHVVEPVVTPHFSEPVEAPPVRAPVVRPAAPVVHTSPYVPRVIYIPQHDCKKDDKDKRCNKK